ncbi:MAG: hypothetical protein EBV20_08540 [Betaproteobacteria bacterium]|nr:hypothetical protein [Betaproteobacteria bacterium]NBP45838.1 hypothetical protein [Betaproteobacteria bacterium]
MESTVEHANSYLQYLELSQKTKMYQAMFAERPICEKLLGMIALENEAGKPYTVSEIMRLEHLGSPCTIHRRMETLREAGLIAQVYKNGDRRTKYLVPTRTASRYFKVMDHVIRQSIAISHSVSA